MSSLGPAASLSLQDSGDVEATENANTGIKGLREIDSNAFKVILGAQLKSVL